MKIERINIFLFILISALLTTFWDYQFGQMDHVEHLPLLYRAADAEYLKNDFFLNANDENYDPRYYYSLLINLLNRIIPLPWLFLSLTFLANYGIAWSSYHITRHFFGSNNWSGLLAVMLVMAVPTAELGSVAEVHAAYLTPNALAFSLILIALNFVIRSQWHFAGFFFGIAALIHPLAGPECGLIFLGLGFIDNALSNKFNFRKYSAWAKGFGFFVLMCLLSIVPFFFTKGEVLDDKSFIDLYAHFRVPHHVLPSVFLNPAEIKAGIYLLVLLLMSWTAWFAAEQDRRKIQWLTLSSVFILLMLAIGGYVFVEIYPMKLFVIAHTFRLLYILKWFCLIWVGGYIGIHLFSGQHLNRIYAWSALLSSFALPNLVWIFLLWGSSSVLHRRLKLPQFLVPFEVILVMVLGCRGGYLGWLSSESAADIYLWAFFLFSLPLFAAFKTYRLQIIVWIIAASGLISYWSKHQRSESDKPLKKAMSRQFDLNDFPVEMLELASKIKKLTPSETVLVVPPMMGEIRYLAERALLVSFKTLPFSGKKMLYWKERVFDCYGWTDLKGFDAVLWAFEPAYKLIKEDKLHQLYIKYGATYAILYIETICSFPILYENKKYKLVYIGNSPARNNN